ncbi:MAG: hypothetical protein RR662_07200 [Clostridia bacterium]
MNDIEIFKKINNQQISGIMFHNQMIKYYDFLGFRCFKRMHEYYYFKENASNDTINRYVINHLNKIIINADINYYFKIPENWENVNRLSVQNENRKSYLKQGIEKMHEFEIKSKEVYQNAYKELCNLGEVASAKKVMQLVEYVDMELKEVERLYLKLQKIDFDLKVIETFDNEMHDCYKEKTKNIGIDIC